MAKFTETPKLSTKYETALVLACTWHRYQIRKNEIEAPYISHLLAVSSLVLEAGGDQDEAIAALLHDSIEDVDADQNTIVEMFGQNVLNIILEVTEDKELPKEKRKTAYCQRIKNFSLSALRVSIADKLHNIRGYSMSPELWGKSQKNFYDSLLYNYKERGLDMYLMEQVKEIDKLFLRLS